VSCLAGSLAGATAVHPIAPQWSGIYHPDFFKPDRSSHRGARSEAELTEQQISNRERRLFELGENFADSSTID